jgi:aminoglycoside phosphotransferase (APT) family kinase protein
MTDIDISDYLLPYLRKEIRCPHLAYAERPVRMTGGYDAAIFSFRLEGASEPFTGRLVLRLFQAGADAGRAAREAAVQNAIAALGYPAPRAFVAETSIRPLGGAFLIMERMPSHPLGSEFEGLSVKSFGQMPRLLLQLPRVRREIVRLWDEAQTRLHALPVDAFLSQMQTAGLPKESFTFDAYIANLRAAVDEFGLGELRPGIEWLAAHRPNAEQTLVICHGDFQPLNVLADVGQLSGVIDWVKLVIAAPAFDYGAALAILATIPIRVPAGLRGALRAFMINLARQHSRSLRPHRSASDSSLCYYQVFNCLVQLVTVGRSRAQGRMTQGAYNSSAGVANLTRHIRVLTGLQIGIG